MGELLPFHKSSAEEYVRKANATGFLFLRNKSAFGWLCALKLLLVAVPKYLFPTPNVLCVRGELFFDFCALQFEVCACCLVSLVVTHTVVFPAKAFASSGGTAGKHPFHYGYTIEGRHQIHGEDPF